ncbi:MULTISPECIES: TonB-dependent receptor [unclassified Modicisalibacter]|uniref:OmpP1/FadL family transporter n=1 Tax=unclassified Modicisalibacter TaxID=2679913 RepID=UPI001CCD1395|nr:MULTISPECIES: TonB-dependent receptor [unclassified Modicisalibacter]MBZ9558197.1 TonB-dependent receptor [Modicisalibacter sp. R2A 31.J]MBZ9573135.1 TonB-dependent receptor [Modicisalibacter sp. MOD 31.J]
MDNKINKLALAIAAASTVLSGQALAGGFQLNEQSVSAQGSAFAGRTSNVTDASIVFGNPAGMSFLERAQVTGGATYLDVDSDIDDASGTTALGTPISPASNEGDMVPGKTIPFGYFVQPINDHLHFGLGVYAPFGVITDYEDDFEGRYFGNYSDVEVVTVQPTLSIKFSDQFSAGFGITYNHIEGELERATYGGPFGDGHVKVKGDDDAYGFTFGMMYKPLETTTLGVTYRSDVDYGLEGHLDTDNIYAGGAGPLPDASYDASLDITLPETIDFSVTHEVNDRWTVMAGAALVKWSSFDELVIENDSPLGTRVETQDYEDAWQYAVGTAYQLTPSWVVRAGVAYDESPIRDSVRTVRVPSSDRMIYSLGAGWTPTPDLTIDVAYTYLKEDTAPVDETAATSGSYRADYENSAQGFGAQLTYRF